MVKECQTVSWIGNGIGPCPDGSKHDVAGSFNYSITVDQDSTTGQHDWKYCSKCQGLAWIGGGKLGKCVAGGSHDHSTSGNYTLTVDGNGASGGQNRWRWCNKCQMLAYDGYSSCAGGGSHINAGGGEYTLVANDINAKGQDNWKWCNKCYGIAYAGSPSLGTCPQSGVHDHTQSGNYVLGNSTFTDAQDGWSWCNKCQLLWYSANGPARCPQGTNSFHESLGSAKYFIEHAGVLLPTGNAASSSSISSSSPTSTTIPPSRGSKKEAVSKGGITGIAIGVMLLFLVALGAVVIVRRHRRRSRTDLVQNLDASSKPELNHHVSSNNTTLLLAEMDNAEPSPTELESIAHQLPELESARPGQKR